MTKCACRCTVLMYLGQQRVPNVEHTHISASVLHSVKVLWEFPSLSWQSEKSTEMCFKYFNLNLINYKWSHYIEVLQCNPVLGHLKSEYTLNKAENVHFNPLSQYLWISLYLHKKNVCNVTIV